MFDDFSFPENRDVYEIIWKNTLQSEKPQWTSQYGA